MQRDGYYWALTKKARESRGNDAVQIDAVGIRFRLLVNSRLRMQSDKEIIARC